MSFPFHYEGVDSAVLRSPKFGEADPPRQISKLRSAGGERAPNLRASRIEDLTTDTEAESPNKGYRWLLNDSSQSCMEGESTSKRRY